MSGRQFLLSEEQSFFLDISKRAYADAPPEAAGPTVLVCPHCGHDERGGNGPHEIFDLVQDNRSRISVLVSDRHFRCRECGEGSPVWSLRRDGVAISHLRAVESGESCMPAGFHTFMQRWYPK
ncbi:hypothetical protein [Aureimonas psammosilenae]|uniref:hypothetical protein n=1 Tax=Aureimonas psammosilenae TaxID=2495496 RepID=UPI00126048C3|nr:hypothetical protein [Aureimonas psammosilenae]